MHVSFFGMRVCFTPDFSIRPKQGKTHTGTQKKKTGPVTFYYGMNFKWRVLCILDTP